MEKLPGRVPTKEIIQISKSKPKKSQSCVPLKVHKNENFLASILNFVLFQFKLCINNKILVKKIFDWTIMGGAMIILRSPRTTRNEKNC